MIIGNIGNFKFLNENTFNSLSDPKNVTFLNKFHF